METTFNEEQLRHIESHVGGIIDSRISKFLTRIVLTFAGGAIIVAVSWGALFVKVNRNTEDISALSNTANVSISRDQLDDILGSRDQRLTNIEASISRIETKLDRVIK